MSQKSHKKDNGENNQIRTAKPTGSVYGLEKGNHPNRRVDPERWSDMREDDLERRYDRLSSEKLSDRRGPYGGLTRPDVRG